MAARLCQVDGCDAGLRAGQLVCHAPWSAMPGRVRSALSMSRRGKIADEMWARVIAALKAAAA